MDSPGVYDKFLDALVQARRKSVVPSAVRQSISLTLVIMSGHSCTVK